MGDKISWDGLFQRAFLLCFTAWNLYVGGHRYANGIMQFKILPSAIVGAGSFWNYQSKLTPDSKEFAMMIDTQRKVSRFN